MRIFGKIFAFWKNITQNKREYLKPWEMLNTERPLCEQSCNF